MKFLFFWAVLFAALNVPHSQSQDMLTEPKFSIDLNAGELADLIFLLSSQSYTHTKKVFPKQVYRFGRDKTLSVSGLTLHVIDTPLSEVLIKLREKHNLCAWRHNWHINSQPVVDINFGYCDGEPPFPDNMKDRFQAYP